MEINLDFLSSEFFLIKDEEGNEKNILLFFQKLKIKKNAAWTDVNKKSIEYVALKL